MKKYIFILFAVFALAIGADKVFADSSGVYEYGVSNGEAVITGVVSKADFSGAQEIPAVLGEYPVTAIENSAFENCISLTSVTIPAGVTTIDYGTFSGCVSLKSIEFLGKITEIRNYAFRGCTNLSKVWINENYVERLKKTVMSTTGNEDFLRCLDGIDNDIKYTVTADTLTSVSVDTSNLMPYATVFISCGTGGKQVCVKSASVSNAAENKLVFEFENSEWEAYDLVKLMVFDMKNLRPLMHFALIKGITDKINELLGAADAKSAANILDKYKSVFGTDFKPYTDMDGIGHDGFADMVYKNLLQNGELRKIAAEDNEKAIVQIRMYAVIDALNNGKIENLFDYADEILLYNSRINDWYKRVDGYIQIEITHDISTKGITTANEFENKLTEALILNVVAAPDGWSVIRDLLMEFRDFIGVNIDRYGYSCADRVCKEMAGKKYPSIDVLRDKMINALESMKPSSGSSGGGSSGGGSSGGGSGGGSGDEDGEESAA